MSLEDRLHEKAAEKGFLLESEGGPPGHWKLFHAKSGRLMLNGSKREWWDESDLEASGL